MVLRAALGCLFHSAVLWLAMSLMPSLLPAADFSRPVDHKLIVHMKPSLGYMKVEDTLTFYPRDIGADSLVFLLHGGFELEPVDVPHTGNWTIHIGSTEKNGRSLKRVEVFLPPGGQWPDFLEMRFRYQGRFHNLQGGGASSGGPPATVVLSEASYFYPVLQTRGPGPLLTFTLETVTSPGWRVVSQGKRLAQTPGEGRIATLWKCDDPMEEVFLITGRYHEFQDRMSDVTLRVFLLENDEALARRYLQAAQAYLRFYEKMLGPYPYVKFAVVENSEPTGYGMPSFTLLGSRILRFPFILHTSYPHEILHNWWGNGVYLHPDSGNWSEGLTAYLSDHLLPELQGKGAGYRFQELMKYLNYVTPEKDFPLTRFAGRTDMASQAVGYGKWLMVLHMLRLRLGNLHFLEGLHTFYFNQTFRRAGFEDLRRSLEEITGQNLEPFFARWVHQAGAPKLRLQRAETLPGPNGYRLEIEVAQVQPGEAYPLTVPLALWQGTPPEVRFESLHLTRKRQVFAFELKTPPVAVKLDPRYDVFRRLNRDEVPPSLGQTYGAPAAAVLFSPDIPQAEDDPYRVFAGALEPVTRLTGWTASRPVPEALWVLGRDPAAEEELIPWLAGQGVRVSAEGVEIRGRRFPWKAHSFVFTLPHPANPKRALTWLVIGEKTAARGLIRKLPHYGKYGYLVFRGAAPDNVARGMWRAEGESMFKRFDGGHSPLPLPPRPPLVDFVPEFPPATQP